MVRIVWSSLSGKCTLTNNSVDGGLNFYDFQRVFPMQVGGGRADSGAGINSADFSWPTYLRRPMFLNEDTPLVQITDCE